MIHSVRRRVLVGAALVAVASPALALYDPKPDDALAAAQGAWRGTLTYRDYRDPDRRVTLPTVLHVALAAPDTLVFHYAFDDGPGKTVWSYETMRFDFAGGQVVWTTGAERESSTCVLASSTSEGATRRLVFERRRDGRDRERFTMTLSAATLELAKDEVDASGTATFRNRFAFTRG